MNIQELSLIDSGGLQALGINLIAVIYILVVLFVVVLVIMENRHPYKTLSWVLVLVLLPVLGFVLYLFIGRNFRKQKMFSRKELKDLERIEKLSEEQLLDLPESKIFHHEKVKSVLNVITLLLNNSKALLTENNKVEVLNNGKETFSSILEAINNAQDHIHLEYYILEDGKIGDRIKELLVEKAKKGLEVRVIYDAVGSWNLTRQYVNTLHKAGVEAYEFMPVHFPKLTSKINYRNHRKIVIIDGKTGFLGGINIADRYMDGHSEIGFWRDTHLRLEGDAVRSLQTIFLTDWFFVSKKIVHDKKYLPEHQVNERCLVQIAASGPDSDWASIMQAYFTAITSARKHVFISTPYFAPNESIMTALKTAALSGTDVRIIMPGKTDSRLQRWSSLSYVEELLEAGVSIFVYEGGFTHSKLLLVDGIFSSVGTANMDIRSFNQNFEVNALIYDLDRTRELENSFLDDLEKSKQIYLEEFRVRTRMNKFRESLARLFSPLL